MKDILTEQITVDIDLDEPLKVDSVDYKRVDVYVKNRVEQVFSQVDAQLDKIERKVDEKIKLYDWQEA